MDLYFGNDLIVFNVENHEMFKLAVQASYQVFIDFKYEICFLKNHNRLLTQIVFN